MGRGDGGRAKPHDASGRELPGAQRVVVLDVSHPPSVTLYTGSCVCLRAAQAMPLRHRGYGAYISCDGQVLQVHKTKVEDARVISCYVASEAGKVCTD